MKSVVADRGGAKGAVAPPPHGTVKISHKKDGTKGSRIDFMFLAPPPSARLLDPLLKVRISSHGLFFVKRHHNFMHRLVEFNELHGFI